MELNTNISSITQSIPQNMNIEMPKYGSQTKADTQKTQETNTIQTEGIDSNQMDKDLKERKEKEDVEKLKAELRKLTEQLNREINPLNTSIRFGFDDRIDSMYVNVIDTQKDRVIRKIPSDEAIKLMEKMREIIGIIFDKQG